jgi:hypothetical protein
MPWTFYSATGQKLSSKGKVPVSDLANGTDGELITWGTDAVATTVAVGTSGHVLTSGGAGAVPSFQSAAVERTVWAQPHSASGTSTLATAYGYDAGTTIGNASSDGQCGFTLRIPDDFTTLTRLSAIIMSSQNGVVRWRVLIQYGGSGQANNAHDENTAYTDLTLTSTYITELDLSGAATALAVGDRLGIRLLREGSHANDTVTDCYVWGVTLEYT